MTPTLEDLDQRVTVLEERVDEQARLRARQDRDLSEIVEGVRKQDRLLKALAQTQSEHTRTLAQHGKTLDEHTHALAELKGGVTHIIGMLDTLIAREDDR
jgi:septal ring factor EnvC (AmiA/AmiB activator)